MGRLSLAQRGSVPLLFEKKYTQQEIAKEFGCHINTVAMWARRTGTQDG